ncbi:ATP-dependent Clp protease proteolytic subunit-related protein 4, chloroplastic [Fagus crenata]
MEVTVSIRIHDIPLRFHLQISLKCSMGTKMQTVKGVLSVAGYVKPPIFTLCVGNAWGEAALLLAAGAKGNRSALPSSTIMIKQPIARFQGQASDIELARKEVKNVKAELHVGKSPEQIEEDIRRPKYFSPSEAVEYGIIDKVIYNERSPEDRGVVSDLKKAQLI